MKNLYVFFDIDGVLNTRHQWSSMYTLNDNCIRNFAKFIHSLPFLCKLILISSWRKGFEATLSNNNSIPVQELEKKLLADNITVSDKIPVLPGRTRDREIFRYLYLRPEIADNYIIIDDDVAEYTKDIMGFSCMKHLLLVGEETGFKPEYAKKGKKIIRHLNI